MTATGLATDLVGQSTDGVCNQCGFVTPSMARFCPGCGTALAEPSAPAPQLRHVIVLFYDLVGSTALVNELGAEASADLIAAFHGRMTAVMERRGGYVSRYVGDGGLVYFGFPRADEDDAIQAARAAMEAMAALGDIPLPAGLRPLALRVGMAAGMTMFTDVAGRGDARGLDSAGAAPNLASRLLAAAEPGAVLLSDPLCRLLGPAVTVEPLGDVELAGWPEPVRVWRLCDLVRQPDRLRARRASVLPTLYGRGRELDALVSAWREAQHGHGRVVLVQGEAGIGKSRLTRALVDRVREEGGTCLRFFCSPESAATPFSATIQHIEHWSGFADGDSVDVRAIKLDRVLGDADPLGNDLVRALFGLPVGNAAAVAALTPRQRLARLSVTFAELALARCHEGPLLILYEDVHWADPSTLVTIAIGAERVATLPAMVVMTARPEFTPTVPVQRIDLPPLATHDAAALVQSVSGAAPLGQAQVADIVARTDGVPLFIEEMTRRVLEAGQAAVMPADGVPLTLMASLTARLDRLGDARVLATAASVIGREFSRPLLAEIADLREADVTRHLDRLRQAGIVQQTTDDGWRFRHALMQEAAYGLAPRRQRAQLHARAAAAITVTSPRVLDTRPQLLARHWTAAGEAAAAVPLWLRAGILALQRGALQEAMVNLQEGLGLVTDLPQDGRHAAELQLRMVLGKAQIAVLGHANEGPAETYARARVLAEAIGADDALVSILFNQVTRALVSAEYVQANELARVLCRLGRKRQHRPTQVLGQYSLAMTLIPLGPFGAAERLLRHCMEQFDPAERDAYAGAMIGHPLLMMMSFRGYTLTRMGRTAQARAILEPALAESERIGDAYALVTNYFERAYLAYVDEPADEALSWADRSAKTADDCGAIYFSAMSHALRGWALARLGDPVEGLRLAREATDTYAATGARLILADSWTEQAHIMARLGDIAGGLALVDRVLAEAAENRGRWVEPGALLARSHLLRLAGEEPAAQAAEHAAHVAAEAIGAHLLPVAWRYGA